MFLVDFTLIQVWDTSKTNPALISGINTRLPSIVIIKNTNTGSEGHHRKCTAGIHPK